MTVALLDFRPIKLSNKITKTQQVPLKHPHLDSAEAASTYAFYSLPTYFKLNVGYIFISLISYSSFAEDEAIVLKMVEGGRNAFDLFSVGHCIKYNV